MEISIKKIAGSTSLPSFLLLQWLIQSHRQAGIHQSKEAHPGLALGMFRGSLKNE
jgi:hypothetical protein